MEENTVDIPSLVAAAKESASTICSLSDPWEARDYATAMRDSAAAVRAFETTIVSDFDSSIREVGEADQKDGLAASIRVAIAHVGAKQAAATGDPKETTAWAKALRSLSDALGYVSDQQDTAADELQDTMTEWLDQ